MKARTLRGVILLAAGIFGARLAAWAADRYVVEPGTPGGTGTGPFEEWTSAATQIQWAVDAALPGETVWVSNGTYVLTNQIVIINAIKLIGAGGPETTVIDGGFVAGSAVTNNRCLWMSNTAAFVAGLTFSNGAVLDQHGGGIWTYGGTFSNVTVRDNRVYNLAANYYGGGLYNERPVCTVMVSRIVGNVISNLSASRYCSGGGAMGGVFTNCVISSNRIDGGFMESTSGGAGVGGWWATVYGSLISHNVNQQGYGGGFASGNIYSSTVAVNQAKYGGGILLNNGTISNCVVVSNSYAGGYTGGVLMFPVNASAQVKMFDTLVAGSVNPINISGSGAGLNVYKVISGCVISNNTGTIIGAQGTNTLIDRSFIVNNPGRMELYGARLRDCLIAGNSNTVEGTVMFEANCVTGSVSGCTIADNYSPPGSAGLQIAATNAGVVSVSSCILYNNGVGGTNDAVDTSAGGLHGGAIQYSCLGTNPGFSGTGLIQADPRFADAAGGNYRLRANSPCVDQGFNEDWMTAGVDLAGGPRILYGTVDMGAYELLKIAGSIIRFR